MLLGGVPSAGRDAGAGGRARAAGGALAGDEARPVADGDAEVARLAFDLDHFCVVEHLDVGVFTDFGELRRLDADGAVQGGEVLVERRHLAPDGRPLLHEDDLSPGLREVEGRLDPGDAAADDEHGTAHDLAPTGAYSKPQAE